jgi:hypothetical protein
MEWDWLVRRHGLVSAVTLLVYLVSLPPALWLFLNGGAMGSSLLLLVSGAVGAILGAVVFIILIAMECPVASRPRRLWLMWWSLVAVALVVYMYFRLTPLPPDAKTFIASAGGGFSLASLGFVVASGTPRMCAFLDHVLGRTVFAKCRDFRMFVLKLGFWFMIAALAGILLIAGVTAPPVTIMNAVVILISTGFSLVIATYADVFTLATGIYLKHLICVRRKTQ